ncbi:MAG: metal ABC transporter permease [Muribaculaceae bacterium]|nr:metal ABC transporter permease [Muribaculaceae bacterium]MBQ7211319.1 metal ABC transporter permease [Muribaculaceae bacterium]
MAEIFSYTFFQYALIAVVFISVSSAIIGTYIVTRRMTAIAGGITHACFGGLGLGYYFGINPIAMATVFAIASSAGVEWLSSRQRIREDSAIAAVWAVGMAVGVMFVFLTPGLVPDLNSFLFGNILTITFSDLMAFAAFTIVLILFFALFFDKIVAVAFDKDFAKVSGMPVKFISTVMTVMIAVCIVLTIRLIGIMLLMSMLSLPQMIAEIRYHNFRGIMFCSIAVSLVACVVSLFLAAIVDIPCSPIIVIILTLVYIVAKAAQSVAERRKNNKLNTSRVK